MLKKHFPDITNEQLKEKTEQFVKDIEKDILDICRILVEETAEDIVGLRKTLDEFDLSGLPDDQEQLSAMIVHYLLVLLDLKITEGE